jgi:hypothetical protein
MILWKLIMGEAGMAQILTPNFWHRSPQHLFTTGNETRFSKVQQKSPKPFFPFSQPVSASLVVPIPIHVEFF